MRHLLPRSRHGSFGITTSSPGHNPVRARSGFFRRRGVMAMVAGAAVAGLVMPGLARADDHVSLSTPLAGMALQGPSAGGTTFQLDLPTFAHNVVNTGDGLNTSFGLLPNGSIQYWSNGMSGPALVAGPAWVSFSQIAANRSHRAPTGYALSTTGVVYSWGYGSGGQLGNGTSGPSPSLEPVSMPGGLRASAIGGNDHGGFALGVDGKIYAWGFITNPSPPVFGSTTFTPVVLPASPGIVFTRMYVAGDDLVYAWDTAGALYQWNGRVNENVVRAPAGQTYTPPTVDVAPPDVTEVWFLQRYALLPQSVTKSGSSWSVTTPNLGGSCGPVDVFVGYTYAGATLQDTPTFTINTPCAPTNVRGVSGNGQATVSFSAPPTRAGVAPVTGYTVTATPVSGSGTAATASGTSSPIVVTGLVNGTTYDLKVIASNVNGSGSTGDQMGYQASSLVTPQGSLRITGVPSPLTYGDAGFTLATSGGLGSGALTYSVPAGNGVLAVDASTGAVTILGAGTTTVFVVKAADGTNAQSTASVSITVARLPITVTADEKTMPAGGAAPQKTYTIKPPLVGNDTLDIRAYYGHVSGSGVGSTYIVLLAAPITHPNYIVTFVTGTLTEVAPMQDQAALSINGVPGAVTYGNAGFTLATSGGSGSGAISYSVPAGNGVLTVDASTGAATVVGAGTVTVTATKAGDASFHPASTSRSITVAKRAVKVTAADQAKSYGAGDPALTYSVAPALVAGDTLAGSLTYSGANVGSYAIVQATPFANPNYAVTFVPGRMTINPAAQSALSITGVPGAVTYGDAGFTLATSGGSGSGAVTYSVPGDNGVVAVDASTGAATIVGAGTVTVTAAKASDGNYLSTSATLSITVAQRAVTVTAADATKPFGADDPALTYSMSPAIITGDTLAGSLTYGGSNVGTYAIVEDTPFANPNYAVTFVPGTMTITQNAQTQAAIDSVVDLPVDVSSVGDADLVAETTNSIGALSPAERDQIPADVLNALHVAQSDAGVVNHADATSGVSASGEALPWNVRLVVSTGSASDAESIAVQMPGRDVLALYDMSFVDTLTSAAWEPNDGERVAIQLEGVDVAGRANISIVHERADGTLETLPATVGADGKVTFVASSFSRYGVTATALNRSVTFNGNGLTKSTMLVQVANQPTALTQYAFRCPAYMFTGWNTAADGTGTAYTNRATYAFRADVTLYAQWAKNGNGNDNGGGNGDGTGACR